MALLLLRSLSMADPDNDSVQRKVIVENVTTTSSRNSAVAWIVIGLLAVVLIGYIVMRLT